MLTATCKLLDDQWTVKLAEITAFLQKAFCEVSTFTIILRDMIYDYVTWKQPLLLNDCLPYGIVAMKGDLKRYTINRKKVYSKKSLNCKIVQENCAQIQVKINQRTIPRSLLIVGHCTYVNCNHHLKIEHRYETLFVQM